MLFSATMTSKVEDLVKMSLKRPIRVKISANSNNSSLDDNSVSFAPRLIQEFIKIRTSTSSSAMKNDHSNDDEDDNNHDDHDIDNDENNEKNINNNESINIKNKNKNKKNNVQKIDKPGSSGSEQQIVESILLSLVSRSFNKNCIVFFETKHNAHRFCAILNVLNIKAVELHGNINQTQRYLALEKFRTQQVDILVATDVAARGLDIPGVQTVINAEMPRNISIYIHRVSHFILFNRI
jgi:superfamily II DNA/RNA helicase